MSPDLTARMERIENWINDTHDKIMRGEIPAEDYPKLFGYLSGSTIVLINHVQVEDKVRTR